MLGAIIGDKVAWTYEHDLNAYLKNVVSADAPLSLHGKMVQYFMQLPGSPSEDIKTTYRHIIHYLEADIDGGLIVPKPIQEFIQTGYHIQPPELKDVIWPAAYIYCGFAAQDGHQASEWAHEWKNQLHLNKCGYYTTKLAEIVLQLRTEQSLEEQLTTESICYDFIIGKYLRCIKESCNYKIAIDNAMHTKGYKHLNGIIVGALANAYYKEYCN